MAKHPQNSKRSVRAFTPAAPTLIAEEPQRLRFSAAIPGMAGASMLRISIEAHSEPDVAGGERLRMRAHIQANFATGVKPVLAALAGRVAQSARAALPNPNANTGSAVSQALAPLARRSLGWLERRLSATAPKIVAATAPLLNHDMQSWFELHASTAPLADGAKALMPQIAKLSALGIAPRNDPGAPPMEQWAGRIGNEMAQVSMLRLDDHQLPEQVREMLGGKPLHVAAAMVNVVTRKR